MKKIFYHVKVVFLVLCVMLMAAGASLAQNNNQQNTKPTVSKDEVAAKEKITKAVDLPAKFLAANEYLKKYAKGLLRSEIAEHIALEISKLQDTNQKISFGEQFFSTFTESAETDMIIPHLADAYLKAKKYDEAFQVADSFFSRHPEDVRFLTQMTIEGTNLAKQKNTKFAKQTVDYANKGIAVIEADKKPADIDDAKWATYKTTYLSTLYHSAGVLAMIDNNVAVAKAKFEKAAAANPADPYNYYFLGYIADGDYQRTAAAYKASSPGKQRDDLFAKVNAQIDVVIDYYAHAIAVAEGKSEYQMFVTQVRTDLETYYKYRHNNSLNGLQELINKYKPMTLKP
jgi:hypothetical protein